MPFILNLALKKSGSLPLRLRDKKDRHNGRPIIYNNVEKRGEGIVAEDVGEDYRSVTLMEGTLIALSSNDLSGLIEY